MSPWATNNKYDIGLTPWFSFFLPLYLKIAARVLARALSLLFSEAETYFISSLHDFLLALSRFLAVLGAMMG